MTSSLNIQNFIKSLQEDYQPKARMAARTAIFEFANFVIAEAVKICPQSPSSKYTTSAKTGKQIQNPLWTGHSGFLRNSHYVEDPVDNDGFITCKIGFNASYAAAVHERMDLTHVNGTRAKFLEIAMRENEPKLSNYVITAIQKAVGT